MRFLKFRIKDYRAIIGPLEVDVTKDSLIPIIGVNESGKTSILHAIFSFDSFNDNLANGGQHLEDTQNLYEVTSGSPQVSAEVLMTEADRDSMADALEKALTEEDWNHDDIEAFVSERHAWPLQFWITRDLLQKRYSLDDDHFEDPVAARIFAETAVRHTPFILFFDDFRDSIDEVLPIVRGKNGKPTGWLETFEEIFQRTDPGLSVFKLSEMDDRRRATALSKVSNFLNRALTKEWSRFGLDEESSRDSNLKLRIQFEAGNDDGVGALGSLQLQVVETNPSGDESYFYLTNRSKGFYWFCNFVLKLEFNPKSSATLETGAVYLLDEPGSYLHNSAQARLCRKLRQISESNIVVYCTHSHYLLNPEEIPISSIRIASKESSSGIELIPYHEYRGRSGNSKDVWAYQPVWDALEIKPFVMDVNHKKIVVVEGQSDWYCYSMMNQDNSVGFIACTGAGSAQYLISLLLGWGVKFSVLWDNDEEGKKALGLAKKFFGARLADDRFRLIPKPKARKKRELEDLFEKSDLVQVRKSLGLPTNSGFRRTVEALYYSPDRATILGGMADTTKLAFHQVLVAVVPPD